MIIIPPTLFTSTIRRGGGGGYSGGDDTKWWHYVLMVLVPFSMIAGGAVWLHYDTLQMQKEYQARWDAFSVSCTAVGGHTASFYTGRTYKGRKQYANGCANADDSFNSWYR